MYLGSSKKSCIRPSFLLHDEFSYYIDDENYNCNDFKLIKNIYFLIMIFNIHV